MELYLDSSNLELIKESFSWCPLAGITTNPTIIAKDNVKDLFSHLLEIKKVIGNSKILHVQVIAEDYEGIIKDAIRYKEILGEDVYIKIPATKEGIKAINFLSVHGFNVTATSIYTTMQGIMSALAGAKYLAVYYNRIEDNNGLANDVIYELSKIPNVVNGSSKIIAASFRNTNQVLSAFTSGAQSCTVPPAILDKCINNLLVDKCVKDFRSDWKNKFGDKTINDF